MASEYAKRLLKVYRERPNIDKNMFMTSFFKTTPEDITDAEFISIDIERSDEKIAPVLTDISTGAHVVSDDIYTNKTLKPPPIALERPINVYDLLKRQPGETEYQAGGQWAARLAGIVMRSWTKMEDMIKRTIELQASQILQTGTLSLTDADGNARYTLDYKPKATHFPDVGTAWDDANATPIEDLESLMDVIRADGLVDCEDALMGSWAFSKFIDNAKVLKYFSKDGLFLGVLNPRMVNSGAKIQGQIDIGNYKLNIWTYNGRYIPRGSTTNTRYLGLSKVVLVPNQADLDFRKCFGGIPTVVDSMPQFRNLLPGRVVVPGAFDFKPRVYTDEKAETVTSEIKSRPLLIPTSIDRFGCLETDPTT